MGRAPHLGMLEKPSENDYAIVDEVIRELGIEKLADKAYTQISGGERQQALIGRAIAQQPEIIMFDEPTNHLDYGNQLRMVHKIKNLSKKDYTVIMTTHYARSCNDDRRKNSYSWQGWNIESRKDRRNYYRKET